MAGPTGKKAKLSLNLSRSGGEAELSKKKMISLEVRFEYCHHFNPIRTGGPELTIKTGGGQKRLRYIIGPYLGHFKSDFIGVKSKFQNYID